MKKILHTVLQLSFTEYIQTWSGLINEFYQQTVCDESLSKALEIDHHNQLRFSLEVATVLVMIAVMSLDAKPKLVTGKTREKLVEKLVDESYGTMVAGENKELREMCKAFYQTKYQMFSGVCKNLSSDKEERRRSDLIGFARYVVAQVSGRREEDNTVALKELGVILCTASEAFMHLLNNSQQDTGKWNGTCNFTVYKD